MTHAFFIIAGHKDSLSYIQKIQFLLMYMFQHDQAFTKTDLALLSVKASDNMFTKSNRGEIFFFTSQQSSLIKKNPKRVLFTSNFGTGKTLLLRTIARQLGIQRHFQQLKSRSQQMENDPGKSYFVIFARKDSLLVQFIREEFEELKEHVEVVCLESKLTHDLLLLSVPCTINKCFTVILQTFVCKIAVLCYKYTVHGRMSI
jgi:hypothetical protein